MQSFGVVADGHQQTGCRVGADTFEPQQGREVLSDDRPQPLLDGVDLVLEEPDPLREQLQRHAQFLLDEIIGHGA